MLFCRKIGRLYCYAKKEEQGDYRTTGDQGISRLFVRQFAQDQAGDRALARSQR
uniref:Uncharacterized protein n=1 Tax=Hyaloperonospora arabidopsidis (strain Emoy2) TaxID=559515 RepID=M4BX65_HYAAE